MASPLAFAVTLQQQLERCDLDAPAQEALLKAVASAGRAPVSADHDALAEWLGDTPPNPAQLEFEALQARFALRRELLAHTIGTAQVNDLLAARSRQTAHDRIKAGTLLAVRDQGHWRLPTWQFDPDGPDGVIDGLPEVLKALQLSDLAKVRWLQRPQPVFSGATPIELLRQGRHTEVVAEARQVGRGQD